jgi:hypothetical protein
MNHTENYRDRVQQCPGNVERILCKALVLACSTVETARHLLLNKTSESQWFSQCSGQVGKNLTSHLA